MKQLLIEKQQHKKTHHGWLRILFFLFFCFNFNWKSTITIKRALGILIFLNFNAFSMISIHMNLQGRQPPLESSGPQRQNGRLQYAIPY